MKSKVIFCGSYFSWNRRLGSFLTVFLYIWFICESHVLNKTNFMFVLLFGSTHLRLPGRRNYTIEKTDSFEESDHSVQIFVDTALDFMLTYLFTFISITSSL